MRITVVYLLLVAIGCNGVMAPAEPAPRPAEELPTELEEDPMLTAVILATTITAAANVETRLKTPGVLADALQKEKLGVSIATVFPGATGEAIEANKAATAVSNTRNFNCRHQDNNMAKPFGCDGWYKDRKTESELIDLQIAGEAGPALDEGAPEGMADFYHLMNFRLAGPGGEAKIDEMVRVMFVGLVLADLYDFRCENQDDGKKTVCQATYNDVLNAATHHSLDRAGFVVKPIRRVP